MAEHSIIVIPFNSGEKFRLATGFCISRVFLPHLLSDFFLACWESLIKCYSNCLKCSAKSKGKLSLISFFFSFIYLFIHLFSPRHLNLSEFESRQPQDPSAIWSSGLCWSLKTYSLWFSRPWGFENIWAGWARVKELCDVVSSFKGLFFLIYIFFVRISVVIWKNALCAHRVFKCDPAFYSIITKFSIQIFTGISFSLRGTWLTSVFDFGCIPIKSGTAKKCHGVCVRLLNDVNKYCGLALFL